jgi:signal peptidase I
MPQFVRKFIKDLFNIKEWMNAIFFALIFAGIFRTFFFEPYKIPSSSMVPTLQIGDYLFIYKGSYGYSKYSFVIPVPFRDPRGSETIYVKRLVGLPGDRIKVNKGILFINDKPVEKRVVRTLFKNTPLGEVVEVTEYLETLPNGVHYTIHEQSINFKLDFPDTTDEYIVPEHFYFMMGDNRNNSIDSRYLDNIGYVPEENLLGRATVIFWAKDFSFSDVFKEDGHNRAYKLL